MTFIRAGGRSLRVGGAASPLRSAGVSASPLGGASARLEASQNGTKFGRTLREFVPHGPPPHGVLRTSGVVPPEGKNFKIYLRIIKKIK